MNAQTTITGRIVSGVKKGAFFTQLDWVQKQCQKNLGFRPFPGTLNLEIEEEKIPLIKALFQKDGLALVAPDSNSCTGQVYPVSVMGVSGAIVAPAEDVSVHGKNIIEILAPVSLKEALDVADGDEIMLTLM
jgi:CTP-dependent riboflavin kinase